MKRLKSKLTVAFMFLFVIIINSSCNKNEEVYSCDKDVNEWAVKNKEKIKSFFISDVYDFEVEKQRAIFRIFTPKQRYELWADKLERILNLKWTNNEKIHINLLLNNIEPDWFDFDTKNQDEIDNFIKSWIYKAENDLKWKKEFLMAIGVSLNFSVDNNNRLKPYVLNVEKGLPVPVTGGCECSKADPWCTFDCVSSFCEDSPHGCGWLFRYSCDGECGVSAPPNTDKV